MENYLIVELPQPKTVKALGNKDVEITKISIFEMIDNPVKKEVWVSCRNHPTRILLWKGDAYDAIGEWTTQNVIDRVLELYTT
jgi:hypothetical protein